MNPIAPAQQEFGRLPAGDPVFAVLLTNRNGMAVRTISYGAAIQSVRVPGPNGTLTEVTYGHDCLQPYLDHPQYAGATVGRVAIRIGMCIRPVPWRWRRWRPS